MTNDITCQVTVLEHRHRFIPDDFNITSTFIKDNYRDHHRTRFVNVIIDLKELLITRRVNY